MIKNYCLALLYYVALLSAVYGVVTVATWGYNLVDQSFETRGTISRVDFDDYSCFVGKGNMECFKNDND